MFRKVLLASDGSNEALRAAQVAAAIAKRFDLPVAVVHVFHAPPLPVGELSYTYDPVQANREIAEVNQAVQQRTGKPLNEMGVTWTARHEQGHPARVILSVAEEENADLIVMGSRGLSGIKAFFLGSISDRVSHHAHCSVLIVR